jgi:hypothetical protein
LLANLWGTHENVFLILRVIVLTLKTGAINLLNLIFKEAACKMNAKETNFSKSMGDVAYANRTLIKIQLTLDDA